MAAMLLTAQVGLTAGLGQMLILLIVLVALWGIFLAAARHFTLPPLVMTIANIVIAAIVAIVAIRILLSFL